MGLFKRKEKALSATGDIASAIEAGWSALPLLGSGARQRIQTAYNTAQGASYPQLYKSSPALRQVLDGIVRDCGSLELRLFKEVSEAERQPQPDHPAALSLRYPSEVESADAFIRGLILDKLVYDNAYALIVPAAERQLSLFRIPSYMLELQGETIFRVTNYRVWPSGSWTTIGAFGGGSGQPVDFSPEQILHWHGSNPFDPRTGLSPLDTLRGVIAEDAALQQASVELAQAGLQEPSWIFRPLEAPAWSNAARAGFEEDLTNRMRRRTTKPVVLEEGMEVKSFGVSPRDAEMMAVREWAVAQIAAEYGVPRGKAGLVEASPEDEDAYMADVITPLTKDFAAMLNQRICVRVYDDTSLCFDFNRDERIAGNARMQALVSASGGPIMLRNESRAKLNLPPIDGGDEIITPLNVIVGEKPSPQVMPPQDPNKPPQDGSYRTDQGPTPIASENAGKALYALPVASQGASDQFERLPQLHPGRASEVERQRRYIDELQAVVQRHFNRLERSLRAKAKGEVDWARWDREFADDLNRVLSRVVQSEGDVYALKLAAPRSFDMDFVRHYLQAMAESAAGAINDTIRSEIDQLGLDRAMARTPQHVASVGASLGEGSTFFARDEAAKQSPDYELRVKTWVADSGRHAEFDGDTVPVGADWPAGFAPGSAPGCKCTAIIS